MKKAKELCTNMGSPNNVASDERSYDTINFYFNKVARSVNRDCIRRKPGSSFCNMNEKAKESFGNT